MVGAHGLLVEHLERVNLVEMQVWIDERFGHQIPPRVDLLSGGTFEARFDRLDHPLANRKVMETVGVTTEASVLDQDVHGDALSVRQPLDLILNVPSSNPMLPCDPALQVAKARPEAGRAAL